MGPLNRGEDSLLFKDIVHNNRWDWGRLSLFFHRPSVKKLKQLRFLLLQVVLTGYLGHLPPMVILN